MDYWGEEETIEIASDDDTPRATAARASSPTTTADGGVDGRVERGAARTSRTFTTAAAAQREGPGEVRQQPSLEEPAEDVGGSLVLTCVT